MRRRKRGSRKLKRKPKRKPKPLKKQVLSPDPEAKRSEADDDSEHLEVLDGETEPFGLKKELTLNTVEDVAAAVAKISSSLRFEVRRESHPCELKTREREAEKRSGKKIARKSRVVFFVPIDSVKKGKCPCIDQLIDQSPALYGFLVIGSSVSAFAPFKWTAACLRQSLEALTRNCVEECAMCFEDVCTNVCVFPKCRNLRICHQCGSRVCVVCAWKIALENRQLMLEHPHNDGARFQCPVCRFDRNLFHITELCAEIVMQDFLEELDADLRREVLENAKHSDVYYMRKERPTSCSGCHEPFASKRAAKRALACDKCKHDHYCSRLCRAKDRKEHRERCRLWCL